MSEPILWADKAAPLRRQPARRFNADTGQMEDAFDEETGQRLFEKIPQRGHVGGDADNPIASRHARWMHVLRHDGHVVRMVMTCAAADLDMASLWTQERRAKARFFGWIPVGQCPLAMLLTGDIQKGQLIAKENRGAAPCAHGSYGETKPCVHYRAEEAARKELQRKKTAQADKRNQSEADRLVASQADQTKEIVGAITEALGGKKKAKE